MRESEALKTANTSLKKQLENAILEIELLQSNLEIVNEENRLLKLAMNNCPADIYIKSSENPFAFTNVQPRIKSKERSSKSQDTIQDLETLLLKHQQIEEFLTENFRDISANGDYNHPTEIIPLYDESEEKLVGILGISIENLGQIKAQEKIEEQYTILNAILNSSFDTIIFALDREYCYLAYNELHRKEMMNVWNATIAIGVNLLDCMTNIELRELAKASIDRALAGEYFTEVQMQPELNYFYEFSWNPIKKANEITGVTVFIKNITAQRRAEITLKIANQKLRQYIDSNMIGVVSATSDGKILEANDYYLNLIGFSRDEFLKGNIDWRKLTPPEWIEFDEKAISELKERGICTPYEKEYQLRDGSRKAVLLVDTLLKEPDEHIIAFAIDITDKKETEKKLRRQTERLKNLHEIDNAILQSLESTQTIICATQNHLYQFLQCTQICIGLLEPKDKTLKIYTCEFQQASRSGMRNIIKLSNEETIRVMQSIEMRAINNVKEINQVDKSRICTEKIAAYIQIPLRSANSVFGILHVGWEKPMIISKEQIEITEEVARQITIAIEKLFLMDQVRMRADSLEEQVRIRTKELEYANKELEAFSYSVSHDLRAPLRGIEGFTKILMNEYRNNLDAEGLRICNIIVSNVELMGTLIDSLLTFARLSQTELQNSKINMSSLFYSIFTEICNDIERNKIIFTIETTSDIYGDSSLIRQVVFNLLSNAVKFSSKRKEPRIEVKCYQESERYIYAISDNGAGFDMQYYNKLFGVFQRLHSEEEYNGHGVGLAIVQRIIHRHGGSVWAEGIVNKGSTFYFSIPKVKNK